jgi:threonine dehydrogenase-like Zn-dependent dehydrogenase
MQENPNAHPDIVALISVGAVTAGQLNLLIRRAGRSFPKSRIVVGYWDNRNGRQTDDAGSEGLTLKSRCSMVINLKLQSNTLRLEPHIDIPRYIRLMKAGKLSLDGLVTHEFPLEQVNEAIDVVRRGEAGRVLLRME